jgi:hypothetical protein
MRQGPHMASFKFVVCLTFPVALMLRSKSQLHHYINFQVNQSSTASPHVRSVLKVFQYKWWVSAVVVQSHKLRQPLRTRSPTSPHTGQASCASPAVPSGGREGPASSPLPSTGPRCALHVPLCCMSAPSKLELWLFMLQLVTPVVLCSLRAASGRGLSWWPRRYCYQAGRCGACSLRSAAQLWQAFEVAIPCRLAGRRVVLLGRVMHYDGNTTSHMVVMSRSRAHKVNGVLSTSGITCSRGLHVPTSRSCR